MNAPSDLIEGYLDESLTPADAEALRAWLAADREHLKEFALAVHQHRAIRAQLQGVQEARLPDSEPAGVAQIFNLLYRRIASCWKQTDSGTLNLPTRSRLQVGDTADSKSALRSERTAPNPDRQPLARAQTSSVASRPFFHFVLRPWIACAVVVALAALVAFIVLREPSSRGLPTLTDIRDNLVTIEPPPSLAARVSGSLNRTGVVLLQRLGRWLDRFAPKFGPGSVIRTGPGGFARLGYTNETTFVELKENSSLRIQSAKSGKRFELLVGTADIHATPQAVGRPLQIATPRAEIRVLGTKLSVAASAKSTRVKVTEGTVQLAPRARHPSAEVAAGQIAIAAADAAVMTQTMRPITNHFGAGSILRELWLDVRGMKVQDLTASPNFPDRPNGREQLPIFETPMAGPGIDLYGARFRGYIHPPVTGQYTFWIAADDSAELWLSPDDRPDNKRRICQAAEWSLYFRNWWHDSEQESSLLYLEAGRHYYIEALHKEGGGGDFLSVAWQPPGSEMEVIAGADLSPFEPPRFE